jgi:hypothetical protein
MCVSKEVQLQFAVGDKAVYVGEDEGHDIKSGSIVSILTVDTGDKLLPYRVAEIGTDEDSYDYEWMTADDLEAVPEDVAPDHRDVSDEVGGSLLEDMQAAYDNGDLDKYAKFIDDVFITNNPKIGEEFKDISHEESRAYRFPGDEIVEIEEPVALRVSASGGHYVVDSKGVAYYIPKGFIAIAWNNYEDQPRINF